MEKRFLSKRYWNTSTTPMSEVMNLAKEYDDIINLSLGDPDHITHDNIINAAFEDSKKGHTRYADSMGDIELREEITKYYYKKYVIDFDLSEVMSVVGACHGMYLILEAILDEGDEVIIHEPYFTPYDLQVKLARGKSVMLKTYEEDRFQINIENLKPLITDKTKAIIINNPNNPTGASFSRDTIEQVCKLAIEKDILIISDEVYGSFSFEEDFMPVSSFEGMKERTVTIGSFSKDYSMTGWRIGYVIAPSNIISCIRDINEGVCFSAPSISQRAALYAIKNGEEIKNTLIKEYKKRVYYAYERIKNIPKLSLLEPQGTFYLFINIKETGLSSVEISKILLEEAHVLVIPGTAFGESGEGYIRIACTVGVDKLDEAFSRIEKMSIFSK